jgi:hypothetical protein
MSTSRDRSLMGSHKSSGGGKSAKKKHIHHIHVRPTKNGGFVVENHHNPDPNDPGAGTSPDEYSLSDMDQLHQHMDEHLPPAADPGAAPAGAQAPPPDAAPAAPAA